MDIGSNLKVCLWRQVLSLVAQPFYYFSFHSQAGRINGGAFWVPSAMTDKFAHSTIVITELGP